MNTLQLRQRAVQSFIATFIITAAWKYCCAQVIYQTGFEQPNFMPGLLDMPELPEGQDGWRTMFGAIDAAMITDVHPKSGEQSLQFDGADLEPCCGNLLGTGARWELNLDPFEHDFPIINIRADMRLDGPQTDGDLISVNLGAHTLSFRAVAGMILSSIGEIWAARGELTSPIEFGQYYNLGLRLDYAEEMSEFFVNDDSIGVEPFHPGHAFQELSTVALALLAVNDPGKIDPADYTAYVDNLIIYEGDELPLQPGALQAGDADQDMDFDQLDLVRVQQSAKYLTGQLATWGEGDWNGAPGGSVGRPPPGDAVFDQLDIVSALATDLYLTGPFAALVTNGSENDGQASVVYLAASGAVRVDAPPGTEPTSTNLESAAGIFTGQPALNLGGSFDNDSDNNVFKAAFGGSFGSASFGTIAKPELSEQLVVNDLSVVGSLQGGGGLGELDLIYIPVPEPPTVVLLGLTAAVIVWTKRSLHSTFPNSKGTTGILL